MMKISLNKITKFHDKNGQPLWRRCNVCGDCFGRSEWVPRPVIKRLEIPNVEYMCRDCRSKYLSAELVKEIKQLSYQVHNSRGYVLMDKYNLTQDEYNAMLEQQGGGCGICGAKPDEFERHLHVDHDHKTGRVRGILCSNCNTLLGKLGDDYHSVKRYYDWIRNRDLYAKGYAKFKAEQWLVQ